MAIKKTYEDGWDCEPNFSEAVKTLDWIKDYVYEIKHCVRESDINDMKSEMIDCLKEAIMCLEDVNESNEWETIHDEYEDDIHPDIDPAGGYGLHSHI